MPTIVKKTRYNHELRLIFYKQKDCKTTDSDIRSYLDKRFNNPENSDQYWYENKETGVYFCFEYNEPEPDDETIEGFENFDNTNWTFNINFLRPQFFGLESFPFVESFVNDLDLLVFNPQANGDDSLKKYSNKELFDNWSAINMRHSSEFYTEYGLCYLDLQKSDKSWEFNKIELNFKIDSVTRLLFQGFSTSKSIRLDKYQLYAFGLSIFQLSFPMSIIL
ncbi:MAG: hypothetical protein HC905_04840 [Bacteroidales bacterium]|nr:hypothetical protein [Bacteroidales bacterium]